MSTVTDTSRTPLPLLRLDAAGDHGETVLANVQLSFGGRPADLEIRLPAGPVPATDLLPVYQGLTNLVVDVAVDAAEWRGETISCRKGCGACCRQPVPVSETEAPAIARLVAEMPEPRRTVVRKRFTDVRERLAAAGLLGPFSHPELATGVEAMANSARYFDLGIACPFLDDESCSIHTDRPLACREYLVSSPAENCSRPSEDNLRPIPLGLRVAAAVRAGNCRSQADSAGWVLLALAPEWAAAHPEPPPRSGPDLLQEFLENLLPRTDWVWEANLRPFLTAVGWAVGAEFGPGDWAAVHRSVSDTDEATDRWCDFSFAAPRPARLRLARTADGEMVRFQTILPDEISPQVRLAAAICQRYRWTDSSAGPSDR